MKIKALIASCYIITTAASPAVPSTSIQSSSSSIQGTHFLSHVLVRRSGSKKGNSSRQQNSPKSSPTQSRASSYPNQERPVVPKIERPRPPPDSPIFSKSRNQEQLSAGVPPGFESVPSRVSVISERPRPPQSPTSKIAGALSPKTERPRPPDFGDQAGPSRSPIKKAGEIPSPETKSSHPPIFIDRNGDRFQVNKNREVVKNPPKPKSPQTPSKIKAQKEEQSDRSQAAQNIENNPYSVLEISENSGISQSGSPRSRTSSPIRDHPSSSKSTSPQNKQQASSSKVASPRSFPKHKKVGADLPDKAEWGQDWHTTSLHVVNTLKPYAEILRPGSPERGWVTPGQDNLALKRMKEKPGAWAHATATAHGPAFVSAFTPSSHTPHLIANTGGNHQTHAGAHDPDLAVIHGKSFENNPERKTVNDGRITSKVVGKYVGSKIITHENGHAYLTVTDDSGRQSKVHVPTAPPGKTREDNTKLMRNMRGKQQTIEATLHGHGKLFMYSSQKPVNIDFGSRASTSR